MVIYLKNSKARDHFELCYASNFPSFLRCLFALDTAAATMIRSK